MGLLEIQLQSFNHQATAILAINESSHFLVQLYNLIREVPEYSKIFFESSVDFKWGFC